MYALLIALYLPALALAQDPPGSLAPLPADAVPNLTLTISGGGSLGMYQAGQLYYLSELYKANPGLATYRTLTGTSAGAINSFVGVMALCSAPVPDPRDSPTYRTWAPVGLDSLYRRDTVDIDGIFDREQGLGPPVDELRALWAAGLPEDCDLNWGAAVSRLIPRNVPLASGFDAPMGLEHFAVRIQGRGPGRPPQVTPIIDTLAAYPQAVLPLDDESADAFGLIEQVVYASSAFPIGFKPVEIPYCLRAPDSKDLHCSFDEIETARFVDGGAFDNSPLRLALRLTEQQGYDKPLPIYVDAYLGRFPEAPASAERTVRRHSIDNLIELLQGILTTSKRQQVLTLLEEDPTLRERITLATSFTPQTGREVYSFMALFDQQLRDFDFYLGVYSAHRQVVDLGSAIRRTALVLPEDLPGRDEGWAPFHCLQATLEGPEGTEACLDPQALALAPLIQTSIERLYAWCAATTDRQIAGAPSEHCKAARSGEAPPLVRGLRSEVGDDWRIRDGEHALAHALRRSAYHGFIFRDLGLDEPDAKKSAHAMRRALKRMVHRLASKNGGQALLIRIGGEAVVEDLIPIPRP